MKQKIFAIVTIIILFLGLYIPHSSRVNASGGNLCSESILPPDYRDPGDTSPYLFDARYPTMTGNTLIYKDGKIGILLYNCSYTGIYNYDPGRYLMQTFIRKSNGEMIYLPIVDRGALLNNWSDVRRVGPVDVHKTFDFDPVYIDGAAPLKPNIKFTNGRDYEVWASFSGSCDWNRTKYSFDYYGIDKYTGKTSYIEDEYTFMKADDYICGFYYTIDENSWDIPFSENWKRLDSKDYSGGTRELAVKLPQKRVSAPRDYYLHVAAVSYTGKISPVTTAKVPKRGVHTVEYNLNGGIGDIQPMVKCVGTEAYITGTVPYREGWTFTNWRGGEYETYGPGQPYTRDQDGGSYLITAEWRENMYRIVFDPNAQSGRNGRVTGSMPTLTRRYRDVGLPKCGFKNEDVDEAGVNKFKFVGWSLNPNDKKARFREDAHSTISISQIVRESGRVFSNNATIRLYAIWDKRPDICGMKDRYITSDQISSITPSELIDGIYGEDREDGRIDKVELLDFTKDSLKLVGDRCAVKLKVKVVDSAGNETTGGFWVNIVSSKPIVDKEKAQMYVRFIDKDNYDRGNLISDSIWYWNDSYKETIKNIDPKKPKKVVKFSL